MGGGCMEFLKTKKELGTFLKNLREKAGFKADELANFVDVTSSYICQIEKGKRIPSDELCIKMAEILNFDTSFLLKIIGFLRLYLKNPKVAEFLYCENLEEKISPKNNLEIKKDQIIEKLKLIRDIHPEEEFNFIMDIIERISYILV